MLLELGAALPDNDYVVVAIPAAVAIAAFTALGYIAKKHAAKKKDRPTPPESL